MKVTTFDLKKTALLVVDMQNGLLKGDDELASAARKKRIIANMAGVIAAARRAAVPVIYSVHVARADGSDSIGTVADSPYKRHQLGEGTTATLVTDELEPRPTEYVLKKRRSSAFYGSDLELILRCLGRDTLLIGGVVTNGCIAATVDAARERDLHVIVLSDCCAAAEPQDDVYYLSRRFPMVGRVRSSEEVIARLAEAGTN